MLDFQKAISAIENSSNILILPSSPVDGDSLGSALALYDVLKAQGKSATVVLTSDIPDIYKFLPNISHIHSSAEMYSDFMITLHLKDQELENIRHEIVDDHVNIIVTPSTGRFSAEQVSFPEPKKHYDLIITVDCADLTQLGEFYKQHFQIFSEVPSINIDHHISNKNYASLNLVDANYCSTTHILYDMLLEMSAEINPDVATLLLAGIITDTGSFQNTNTTPEAFDVAAELIELGGRQQEIIQHIYKTKQLNSLKLWGKILSKIQVDTEYKLMWTTLTQNDLKETDTTNQDKGEIMDELLSNAEDANIVLLLEERESGVLHGSIRVNTDDINAVTIAENFGGGGHQRAAGFNIIDANVETHESKILKYVRQYLDQLNQNPEQEQSNDLPLQPVAAPVPQDLPQPAVAPESLTQEENLEVPTLEPEMPVAPVAESTPESEVPVAKPTLEPEMPVAEPIPEPIIEQETLEEDSFENDFDDMPPLPNEDPEIERLDFSGVQTKVANDFSVEPPKQENQTQLSELDADFDMKTPATPEPAIQETTPTVPAAEMLVNAPMPAMETQPELNPVETPVQEPENIDPQALESIQPAFTEQDESIVANSESIESELISSASEEPAAPQNLEAELAPSDNFQTPAEPQVPVENMLADQGDQTEDRIKDLSQKFFTEQSEEKAESTESADQFSEIPSFGENLDLSQVSAAEPTQDEMEFPPNPFADQNDPGSLPKPDVPEDL